jgi:hypothetical protein
LAKREKLASNILVNQLVKNRNLAKTHTSRWEGEKTNKEYRRIPDVSFQVVEGHKHNFVSFRILDVS